jgi:hypothetical protein
MGNRRSKVVNVLHDVFISHLSKDKPAADAIWAALEGAHIEAMLAPVSPGRKHYSVEE